MTDPDRPVPKTEAAATATDTKGWYSRGYHPHLDVPGVLQSITFRLGDSVPAELIERWREELQLTAATQVHNAQDKAASANRST